MKRTSIALGIALSLVVACGPNAAGGSDGGSGGDDDDDDSAIDGGGGGSNDGDGGSNGPATGLQGGWTLAYAPGSAGPVAPMVTTDPNGNVYFAGGLVGSILIAGTRLDSAGQSDFYVGKLSPVGELLWVKRFGSVYEDSLGGIDATADGVVLVGSFADATNYGGATLRCQTVPSPCREPFILRLDTSGRHQWSRDVPAAAGASFYTVELQPVSGRIAVIGYFYGSIDIGTGAITGLADRLHALVAVYEPGGTPRWARAVLASTTTSSVQGMDVAFAGDRVVALFTAWQDVMIQGGPAVPTTGYGGEALVLALGVDSGATSWFRRITTMQGAGARSITALGDDAVVAAYVTESATIGGVTLPPIGDSDALLYRLAGASGDVIWARRYGGLDQTMPWGISATPAGDLMLGGWFDGEASFGPTTLTDARFNDAFVVDVDGATGDARVLDALASEGEDRVSDVMGSGEDVIVGGHLGRYGELFGEPAPGNAVAFVAKRSRVYE
jgi:hypothetical protein